jgi:hypothetical protein
MDRDTRSGVVNQPDKFPELAHFSPVEELEPVTASAEMTSREDRSPDQDGERGPTPKSHHLCERTSRTEKIEGSQQRRGAASRNTM